MVNIKIVRNSNNSLQHLPPGLVAVFAGGTAGIGLGTLRAFAKNCNAPKAYIIGRFHEKAIRIIDNLKSINSGGSFVFIEGQVSLIHDVDRMCEEIKKLETHIDILCMSPGYLTFTGNDGKLFHFVT
jgi:NADP-dependent 3-hydroxy acid dehydrogenase YdfG